MHVDWSGRDKKTEWCIVVDHEFGMDDLLDRGWSESVLAEKIYENREKTVMGVGGRLFGPHGAKL